MRIGYPCALYLQSETDRFQYIMIKAHMQYLAIRWQRALPVVLIGLALAGCSRAEKSAAPGLGNGTALRAAQDEQTALDKYVAAPDTNYSFRVVNTIRGKDFTTYILEMTSQAWLTTNEVDRPIWKHWLNIVRPDSVVHPKALLFIGGGANDGKAPKSADGNLVGIARATKSVVAELKMVPNQPLVFAGETKGRKEDSLIAYTWDKFLRTGDAKWPARLPMTKAAVRAMDTVTAFCGSSEGGNVKVDGFVVSGGSKRGWTTWTTAAVDKRVVAIVPCVIDVLNIEASMLHHYAAYGFWAPAIGDYTAVPDHGLEWHAGIQGADEDRGALRVSPPADDAEVHRQRHRRPVLPAGFVAVLFQRPAGREVSALRAQRRSLA